MVNYCPICNYENNENEIYCSNCGFELTNANDCLTTGSVLEGRYRIIKLLGRGGMGVVYQAVDSRLNNLPVAIKEMSTNAVGSKNLEAAINAFKQEATMLVNLRHPALPRITDFFSGEKQHWYLVMDFIEGKTLEAIANERGQIPETEVLTWARQLCEVLEYLHNQKPPVIFRDIKPSNIMLTANEEIKLIDFGIARHFKPGKTLDTVSYSSLGFSAPEQYGESQSDARSDIYALGATLHFLLTGINPSKNPFNFIKPSELITISTSLESAIMSSLEINPDKRPANAKKLLEFIFDKPKTSGSTATRLINTNAGSKGTVKIQPGNPNNKFIKKKPLVAIGIVVSILIITILKFANPYLQGNKDNLIGSNANSIVAETQTNLVNSSDTTLPEMTNDDLSGILSRGGFVVDKGELIHFPGGSDYYNILAVSCKNCKGLFDNIMCVCRYDSNLKRWLGIWQSPSYDNSVSNWRSLLTTDPVNDTVLCAGVYPVGIGGLVECLAIALNNAGQVDIIKSGLLGHGNVELSDNKIIITEQDRGQSLLSLRDGSYVIENIKRSEMAPDSSIKNYFTLNGGKIEAVSDRVLRVKVGHTVAFIPSDEKTAYEFNENATISIYTGGPNIPLSVCSANNLFRGNSYTFLSTGTFYFLLNYWDKKGDYPTDASNPTFTFIVEP